jgi:hypothetical protein
MDWLLSVFWALRRNSTHSNKRSNRQFALQPVLTHAFLFSVQIDISNKSKWTRAYRVWLIYLWYTWLGSILQISWIFGLAGESNRSKWSFGLHFWIAHCLTVVCFLASLVLARLNFITTEQALGKNFEGLVIFSSVLVLLSKKKGCHWNSQVNSLDKLISHSLFLADWISRLADLTLCIEIDNASFQHKWGFIEAVDWFLKVNRPEVS